MVLANGCVVVSDRCVVVSDGRVGVLNRCVGVLNRCVGVLDRCVEAAQDAVVTANRRDQAAADSVKVLFAFTDAFIVWRKTSAGVSEGFSTANPLLIRFPLAPSTGLGYPFSRNPKLTQQKALIMNSILAQTRTHLLALFCLLLPLLVPHSRGDALDELRLRNPIPAADSIEFIGFGADSFIAGDRRGDIFKSTDGQAWNYAGSVGTNYLLRFAYGGGRFVGLSSTNIFSSDDGNVWTVRASAPAYILTELVYGNGTFVAMGGDRVMTSPDGMTWTTTMNPGGNAGFAGIAFGNGLFAAVRNNEFIFTSVDGITWTPHQPDSGYSLSSRVTFGNGFFLVPGATRITQSIFIPGIWASTNGSIWTRLSTNTFDAGGQLLSGGNTFLGVRNQTQVSSSVDGTNLVQTTLPAGLTISRAAYGNGVFVGVRHPTYTTSPVLIRSPNGIDWTPVSVAAPDRSYTTWGGAYGAGRYVLIGQGMATSPDGINFTKLPNSPNLNAIIYSEGQFLGVGPTGGIIRSTDGLAWGSLRSGTLKSLNSIAHGAGRYVAVGSDGSIRVSQNGVVWGGAWSGTDYSLNGVAFGNGQFVAVGLQGIILTSPDGGTWSPQNNADFSTLYKVAFDGGKFVAVGTGGTVLTSANGTAWTRQSTTFATSLADITIGGGLYVAVGGGKVFSSTDAVSWQERSSLGVSGVLGSAFLNNLWVLAGSAGTIYGTVPAGTSILSAATNPGTGNFEVKVTSDDIGATYRLQSCTNLQAQTWSDVTSFIQTQPVTTVIVPGGVGAPQCFYRTVTP